MHEEYINIKSYAEMQGITRQTVYNWIKCNKLEKDRDYILISGKAVIKLNDRTKKLFREKPWQRTIVR